MKFYTDENVWDAAIRRVNWLFNEFENVEVCFSGGKDSTVCLNLALKVAEERGRLPLRVVFIDQEAEWQTVIDYIRIVMSDPRVEPVWLQIPIKIFNATSTLDPWLQCWKPGAEWIRPKEAVSVTENIYGTDRFAALFDRYMDVTYPDAPVCFIAGVRAEESPARLKGLTSYETYGGETWGKIVNRKLKHFTMYPLYDWSYTDVWKAIFDHRWPYCGLYDQMYRHGVPVQKMRVSNVHHETAVAQLFFLQELEPETWNRITARLSGINTAGQMQKEFMSPTALPPMFSSWREYRDYLIENLVPDAAHREIFRKTFASADARYVDKIIPELTKAQIGAVLTNDYEGTKLSVFAASHGSFSKKAGTRGGIVTSQLPKGAYNGKADHDLL